jgi:hypothetical protein
VTVYISQSECPSQGGDHLIKTMLRVRTIACCSLVFLLLKIHKIIITCSHHHWLLADNMIKHIDQERFSKEFSCLKIYLEQAQQTIAECTCTKTKFPNCVVSLAPPCEDNLSWNSCRAVNASLFDLLENEGDGVINCQVW